MRSEMLKEQIDHIKSALKDPKAPFGVDLLLPKVGAGARKTNYDYTHGKVSSLFAVVHRHN